MKTLILATLVIVINLFAIVPLIPRTSEKNMGRNVNKLKKYQWFQDFLSNKEFRELIIHDANVRRTIGKFNSNRIAAEFFRNRYQKKLENILHQKSNFA